MTVIAEVVSLRQTRDIQFVPSVVKSHDGTRNQIVAGKVHTSLQLRLANGREVWLEPNEESFRTCMEAIQAAQKAYMDGIGRESTPGAEVGGPSQLGGEVPDEYEI